MYSRRCQYSTPLTVKGFTHLANFHSRIVMQNLYFFEDSQNEENDNWSNKSCPSYYFAISIIERVKIRQIFRSKY